MELSPSQIDLLFREVLQEYEGRGGFVRSPQPTLLLLGGQPGAGKSTLHHAATKLFDGSAPPITIEGDHFREFHPQFSEFAASDPYSMAAHTAKLASEMTRRVILHAVAHRSNIVLETTLRNPDLVANLVGNFKDDGYSVKAVAVVVKREVSELGIQNRFEDLLRHARGRYTLTELHDAAYNNVPVSLDRLQEAKQIDALQLYSRDALLYQNYLVNGVRTNPVLASQVIHQERLRPMSPEELVRLSLGWESVNLKRLERDAPAVEFEHISGRMASASRRVLLDPQAWAIHAESHLGLLPPEEATARRLHRDELIYTRNLYLRGAIGLPEAQALCCQACHASPSIKEQASLNASVFRFLSSSGSSPSIVLDTVAQKRGIQV